MTEILQMQLEWDEKRKWLPVLLDAHEGEVTALLELGLWKTELRRSGGIAPGTRAVCRGFREACRQACGAEVVINDVLPFLN